MVQHSADPMTADGDAELLCLAADAVGILQAGIAGGIDLEIAVRTASNALGVACDRLREIRWGQQ